MEWTSIDLNEILSIKIVGVTSARLNLDIPRKLGT